MRIRVINQDGEIRVQTSYPMNEEEMKLFQPTIEKLKEKYKNLVKGQSVEFYKSIEK
jgi:membrane protein insertase Oxa1/YidC/SpoIIIJ